MSDDLPAPLGALVFAAVDRIEAIMFRGKYQDEYPVTVNVVGVEPLAPLVWPDELGDDAGEDDGPRLIGAWVNVVEDDDAGADRQGDE